MWTLSPLKLLKSILGPTGVVPQEVLLPVPPALVSPRSRPLTILLLTPLKSNLGLLSRALGPRRLASFSRAYLKPGTPTTPWSPLEENGKNGLKVTVRPVINRRETPRTALICPGLAP